MYLAGTLTTEFLYVSCILLKGRIVGLVTMDPLCGFFHFQDLTLQFVTLGIKIADGIM